MAIATRLKIDHENSKVLTSRISSQSWKSEPIHHFTISWSMLSLIAIAINLVFFVYNLSSFFLLCLFTFMTRFYRSFTFSAIRVLSLSWCSSLLMFFSPQIVKLCSSSSNPASFNKYTHTEHIG